MPDYGQYVRFDSLLNTQGVKRYIRLCYKGPFKCNVTQMGVGVSGFPEKNVTKV